MTETVGTDRPPAARAAVSRPPSGKPATVSASALALHLDCNRMYIGKLEAEGVIQRQGDGFPLDQSRVAYLRFLRRERQQSPRSEPASITVGELISELCRWPDHASVRFRCPLQGRVSLLSYRKFDEGHRGGGAGSTGPGTHTRSEPREGAWRLMRSLFGTPSLA